MKTTLKKILSMLTIICFLITLTACGNSVKSETGITSLKSEDLTEEIFYAGVNHGRYDLNVRCSKDYDESWPLHHVKDLNNLADNFLKLFK